MEIFRGTDIVVLEDNPYRELRFSGTATDSFGKELGEQCCMLGTFSKIVAPGMRIGWVCVRNKELREKLLSYKATADLHTNIFSQLVLAQYLADNDIDAHIEKTKVLYKHKAELMMDCMRKYPPGGRGVHADRGRHVPVGEAAERHVRSRSLPRRAREGRRHLPGRPVL
ncbi:MAG: hypothetical protein ACLUNO_11895 [Oscillospiraceae bacterium]